MRHWVICLLAGLMVFGYGCVSDNEAGSDSAGGAGGESAAADASMGMTEADGGSMGGAGGDGGAGAVGGSGGAGGDDGAGGVAGMGGEGGRGDEPMVRPQAPTHLGGDRPATYFLPRGYDASEPMALVVSLHGYSHNASYQNAYFALSENLRDRNALLITPNGRVDGYGNRFWAANDGCCDGLGTGDSEVVYLRALIEEAMMYFPIDPQRIAIIGYSNGGSMAYRLACDASDLVTNVISLAGTTWAQLEARCSPTQPVSILHVHGTWDTIVRYEGRARTDGDPETPFDVSACRDRECVETTAGCRADAGCMTLWACVNECGWGREDEECRQICYLQAGIESRISWMDDFVCTLNRGCYDNPAEPSFGYSGVDPLIEYWRQSNECEEEFSETMPLDLSLTLPGVDTNATQWADCAAGTQVNLWRMNREGHGPNFTPLYRALLVEWVVSTPRDAAVE